MSTAIQPNDNPQNAAQEADDFLMNWPAGLFNNAIRTVLQATGPVRAVQYSTPLSHPK